MGQTLTHGVYLPDEGERNCYNGLAANWSILDNSVGTVAEHTTQIAGKAPAVHTHTKSDITDFPAYGTTAGTICEGNDSRLSDARTPVAHTHTKSDVTDLFNSANTWSGEQTFAASNTNFKRSFTLGDNSYNICRLQYQDASLTRWGTLNFIHNTDNSVNCDLGVVAKKENDTVNVNASIRLTIKPDNSAELIPLNTNKINLGSSSYQWNNLYAKSYYYNGTAWGLDKANTWTEANSFYKSIQIHGSRNAYIMPEFSASYSGLAFGTVEFKQSFKFGDWVDNNSTIALNTSNAYVEIYAGLDSSDNVNKARLNPVNTTVAELGTSANKWKTLNGVNPGALSLPKTDSSITSIGTSGFSFDGTSERIPDTVNIFSNGAALMNGWLCARIAEGAGHYIFLSSDENTGRYGICSSCFSSGIVTTLAFGINVYVPIKVGDKPAISWAKPNGGNAQLIFYPCLGNV